MQKKNFAEFLQKIILEPDNPGREFILHGQTYGDIYKTALSIRSLLLNISSDEFVCLCSESKDFILSAIIASIGGAPSIVIPHSFNKRVIKEIKNTIGFNTILTDIPEKIFPGIPVVTPDKLKQTNDNFLTIRDADSIFLKIFTGGSTGKPKMWQKTPRNILAEVNYHAKSFNITKDDIFVSTVPPQHIYGLLHSVLIPYVSSARVIEQVCIFPQEIISAVNNNNTTVLVSIPIHYRVLKGSAFKLSSLKLALSSAGNLDFPDAEHFFNQTGCAVTEIFGSTETGGIATRQNSGKETAWKPLDVIEWKIENDRLRVCSEFISPDLPKDSNGFFITEDRVEKKENNKFIHLGRADGVIKVAGKRVDLKEIETALKKIPGVDDVVVVSITSSGGRKNIVAALVEGKIDQSIVKESAIQMLEPYAVPRIIRIVEKIPVLPTGKYDRVKIQSLIKSS